MPRDTREKIFEMLVEGTLEDGDATPAKILGGLLDYADWVINQGNDSRKMQEIRDLYNQLIRYVEDNKEIAFTWYQTHKGREDCSDARFTYVPEKRTITAATEDQTAKIGLDYQDGGVVVVVWNSVEQNEYDVLVRIGEDGARVFSDPTMSQDSRKIFYLLRSFVSDMQSDQHPEPGLNLFDELQDLELSDFDLPGRVNDYVRSFMADFIDSDDPHAKYRAADILYENLSRLEQNEEYQFGILDPK